MLFIYREYDLFYYQIKPIQLILNKINFCLYVKLLLINSQMFLFFLFFLTLLDLPNEVLNATFFLSTLLLILIQHEEYIYNEILKNVNLTSDLHKFYLFLPQIVDSMHLLQFHILTLSYSLQILRLFNLLEFIAI
jgi:hypothetical protein